MFSFFTEQNEVILPIAGTKLYAFERIPEEAKGLVVIAHGSGSSRYSPRDQWMAQEFHDSGLAVFLMDLLTKEEEAFDLQTRELRFDIPFLAERIVEIINQLKQRETTKNLPIGLFGASTGAAAALMAAATKGSPVQAIVSRGGRPDLAGSALAHVKASTLLIIGGDDLQVLELNQEAYNALSCPKSLEIVPGATHLFEEPGKLEAVAQLSKLWFLSHLKNTNRLH